MPDSPSRVPDGREIGAYACDECFDTGTYKTEDHTGVKVWVDCPHCDVAQKREESAAASVRPDLREGREAMICAAQEAISGSLDVIAYGDEPFCGWSQILAERAVDAILQATKEAEPS